MAEIAISSKRRRGSQRSVPRSSSEKEVYAGLAVAGALLGVLLAGGLLIVRGFF